MNEFVHLHVHSSYSFMDGIQHASKIGPTIASRNMKAVALTDHGFMGGITEFVKGCREADVKPIIGAEMYMAFGSATVKEKSPLSNAETDRFGNPNKATGNAHLVVLARNATGYKNLLKLTEYSYLQGFYEEPRIDFDILEQHNEGLIFTTACLSGPLAKFWKLGLKQEAINWIGRFKSIVEPDALFLEVQANNLDIQKQYNNEWILPLARRFNLPVVQTADAHIRDADQWKLHGLVRCIGWKQLPHNTRYEIKDYNAWLYDPDFAVNACNNWALPIEGISNTSAIADRIDGGYFEQAFQAPQLQFKNQSQEQSIQVLRNNAYTGLRSRLDLKATEPLPKQYEDRLSRELELIEDARYAPYFLIVEDYVKLAKSMDIPVGPGRGSGGGSLLAWSLGITGYHMDPIKNELFFERFLNEGRIHINIDYSQDL